MSKARIALAIGTGLTALTALYGIGKAKAATKPAKKATPASPSTPAPSGGSSETEISPGMVLNATTFIGERLGTVPMSENQRSRLVAAFNNLGVRQDGTLRVQPPLWAKEEALSLADAFDAEKADPDIGAAVRDFTLAAMKLPAAS